MQGGDGQNYPQYADEVKQEAARFLCCDFTSVKGHNASEQDHLHASPVIDGIQSIERLNKWTEVAKDVDARKADREKLRERRRELTVDEDVEFQRASQTDAGAAAVADGGALVDEDSSDSEPDSDEDTNGRWEIGPDQEAMSYEDEADFESAKNEKRRSVQDLINSVEEAEDALDRQFTKDPVPLHTVEVLEERLEVLRGERDE